MAITEEIPFHPAADIFPLLQGDDYEALKADIATHGQLEAIWTYRGTILDGRNRYRACQDLGITPSYREYPGSNPVEFVWSFNATRRQLTPTQKAAAAVAMLPLLEAEAKERQLAAQNNDAGRAVREKIPQQDTGKSREKAAALVGVNERYISDAKKIQQTDPAMFEQMRSGKRTIQDAKKILQKKARDQRKKEIPHDLPKRSNLYQLIHAPVSDLARHIEPASVDWIITDPPYPREFLPVYSELSSLAAHALKPGGSLICMVGQSYLPEVLAALTEFLTYQWTLAYLTPGGQSASLWDRKVNTFWKPLLWFTHGEYSGEWVGDVCRSNTNDNDKNLHHWGQSESGMVDIVERFTFPGQVVLDPFVGGGTTGVVCISMNRRFIGADSSETEINTTADRLRNVATS